MIVRKFLKKPSGYFAIILTKPFIMHQTAGTGPCRDLFIYYLKGRFRQNDGLFQSNFVGHWQEEDDSFLFFSSSAGGQIEKLLHHQPHMVYVDSFQMPYDHWLGEVFRTFEHGKFRITPPWESSTDPADASAEKLHIMLDPGLVFGTGTHPTTRDCLEALELAARSTHLGTVLDLGTGTGLLALAAARLGAAGIVGVDLNLLAARTAERNVRLNQLEDRIVIAQGRAEELIACPADLVIANLHYDVMRRLIDTGGFRAKRHFILSGLMRSEAKDIAAGLARHSFKILRQWTHDGVWHTFYGKLKGQA